MNKRIRKKKGIYTTFKDSEWYNLDYTVAKFILPRLRKFEEKTLSCPVLFDDNGEMIPLEKANVIWHKALKKMIWSFEQIVNDSSPDPNWCKEYGLNFISETQKWNDQVQEGINLFAKYFRDLWD